jgi:hypothetical protein
MMVPDRKQPRLVAYHLDGKAIGSCSVDRFEKVSREMRGFKFACLSFTAILAAAGVTSSCNGPSDDCETHRSCSGGSSISGSSGDAGEGNAGTSGTSGGKGGAGSSGGTSGIGASGTGGGAEGGLGGNGNCDPTKNPTEESCLVADGFAVFVAPDGHDEGDGSQASPLATLTKAVEVAAGDRLVLVCSGTYDEHVVVDAGVRVYGGFKCADWTADSAKPLFKPTTAGPALKIDAVDDEVLVEGLAFEVGDAVAAGATALTALVNDSPLVTLRAVSLKAGKGKGGANGTMTPFTFPERTDLDGNSAVGTAGGMPKTVTCPGGVTTTGGIGGTAVDGGQSGSKGLPDHGEGAGGIPGSCSPSGTGQDGANAPDAPAADGAKVLGTLTALGWSSGSGGDGPNGSPGQGGGGGASSKTGGGGGGGAGACGGAGARGGQGGGGSIALAVLDSVVKVEAAALVTADAADGGSSVAGQPGDKDEGGYAGNGTPPACPGGSGGLGGNGAAGGGGAGGISVGIVWKGVMPPTVSADTTNSNGEAGAKGVGGVPGTNDGVAGVAQKLLAAN